MSEVAEEKYLGFEALSNPSFIEQKINDENDVNTTLTVSNPVTETEQVVPLSTAATPVTNVDNGGTTSTTKETTVEDETEKPIEKFIIPGVNDSTITTETPEQIAQKEALKKLQEEQNWINLAKVKGVDLTEDSFEAYNTALDAKFEADKLAAIEAVKKEKIDLELNKLPVEAVAIIEGLKNGMTVDDVLAPVKQIDDLLSLTDAELVAEDLRLQGWSDELIEKKIEDLTESDKLDLEAQPLRVLLNNNKKVVAENQVQKFAQMQQARAEYEKNVRIKESEAIKDTIVSMKTYMDVPVTSEVVNHVQQKWNNGEYHELFKDPKVIAEFLMYKEFGEQGIKNLKNREYQRGRDEKANKLHNIPPVSKTGAVVTPKTAQKAEGNWEILRRK